MKLHPETKLNLIEAYSINKQVVILILYHFISICLRSKKNNIDTCQSFTNSMVKSKELGMGVFG